MGPTRSRTKARFAGAQAARSLARNDRGNVALMTAIMAPFLLGMTGYIVDTGFWIIGSTQLQIAADAAAMGAAQLLTSGLKTQSAAAQQTAMQNVATFEATRAATKLIGAINTPAVTIDPSFNYVQVTLTSQAASYLYKIASILPNAPAAPLLRATATATLKGGPKPCILTLGTSGTGIKADGSASIVATSCPIFSNSNGNPSIYASGSGSISEVGAISGTDIGAAGAITADNGGSIRANSVSANGTAAADPIAGTVTTPAAGTCTTGQSDFTDNHNGQPYVISPQTWCNTNVTFGGNGNTIQLQSGVYYVVNGNLTFNNATVTLASGVSFVLLGSSPGNFSWTNYSNSVPISGGSNGIALWMGCNSSGNQTATFNGGSTLSISGTMYMPCANTTISNNAKLNAAQNQSFSLISKWLYVTGSAQLSTSGGSNAGSSNAGPVLTQ